MRSRLLVLGTFALVSGCSGSCRKTTPYVPFLEDAGPVTAKTGDPATADAGGDAGHKSTFQAVKASIAPPSANKWTLDGLSFEAPPGNVILVAITRDLDGDGQRDVAAYVQPAGGGGGELRFHRGDGKGGLLAGRAVVGPTSTSDLVLPAPCIAKQLPTTMALVGPHSLALDLRPSCGDGAPAARRFVFVAFAPTPSIRWSARISEPPPGWSFSVDVEAVDTDGDGVDDPTFAFALEGGGPPFEAGDRMRALLPYWDRPAGLARDRRFPEQNFQLIAQQANGRATKKASASQALATVRRLRILHGALCAEGGAPWLEASGDRGVACGASKALEDAGLAEVRAALASGDPMVAIGARERLSAGSVARTPKTRTEIDRAIEAAIPVVWGTAREPKIIPSTPSKGAPAWGALAFDGKGSLLVRAATAVVRVTDTGQGTTFEEREADDVASWPWEVTLPGKDARLAAVVDACDAPHLAARVAGHDVPTGSMQLPLPMIPAMGPSRCAGGPTTLSAVPVAWGNLGLYTLVAHEPVIIPATVTTPSGARATGTLPALSAPVDGAYVQGAPRSPNGSWLVVPTRFGLLRRNDAAGGATSLVRVKELEGLYSTLRECAIADAGGKIACVRETKIVLVDATGAAGGTPPALPALPEVPAEDAAP